MAPRRKGLVGLTALLEGSRERRSIEEGAKRKAKGTRSDELNSCSMMKRGAEGPFFIASNRDETSVKVRRGREGGGQKSQVNPYGGRSPGRKSVRDDPGAVSP